MPFQKTPARLLENAGFPEKRNSVTNDYDCPHIEEAGSGDL